MYGAHGLNAIPFNKLNRADFSQLYLQADPRMYYRVLGALDYIIPDLAQPVFMQLIQARHQIKGAPVNVLDLGCSYGVNGALMKYPITWDMLHSRYRMADVEALTSQQLEDYDRHYFQSWPKRRDIRVVGLDSSHAAVRYAERCGSIDRGFAVDLEIQEPADELAALLESIDLIVSTGTFGYITERSFAHICRHTLSGPRAPWIASFMLRVFSYEGVAQFLAGQGLETERFEGATFVQRRFADRDEMGAVLDLLRGSGVDVTGKEDRGLLHAELYVSRPRDEISRCPINRLVSVASGVNRFASNQLLAPRNAGASLQPFELLAG
jgi:SAM-dependent methyltransferase